MKSFRHYTANSIDEAVSLLQTYQGRSKIIAGGTDLLGVLKGNILPDYPEAIIDIKQIKELKRIKSDTDGFLRIAPLTRLKDIIQSQIIKKKYPILSEAAETVASPQIRNMGTVGGNLCQDTRCWYYRYPHEIGGRFNCLRKNIKGPCPAVKGDNRYHAILGGKGCFAVCPSDMAVALTTVNGVIRLRGPMGERDVPVREFYTPLGTVMNPDEFVTDLRVPSPPEGARQTFQKFTLRKPIDFAVVSVATLINMEGDKCRDVKISLGGVSPVPVRSVDAEQAIIGKKIDETVATDAAIIAVKNAKPLSRNAYKIEILKTLIKRSLLNEKEEALS